MLFGCIWFDFNDIISNTIFKALVMNVKDIDSIMCWP